MAGVNLNNEQSTMCSIYTIHTSYIYTLWVLPRCTYTNQQCCCHLGGLAWPHSSFLYCTGPGVQYIQLPVLCVSLTVNNIMRHSTGAWHCVLFVPILGICVRSGGKWFQLWCVLVRVLCSCRALLDCISSNRLTAATTFHWRELSILSWKDGSEGGFAT